MTNARYRWVISVIILIFLGFSAYSVKGYIDNQNARIAALEAAIKDQPRLRISSMTEAASFIEENHYSPTEAMEYSDLLRGVLDKAHIIVIDSSSVNFTPSFPKLTYPTIEALRQHAKAVGVTADASSYEERLKEAQRLVNGTF